MPLTQLIYTSRVTMEGSAEALMGILKSSLRHNQETRITGMLLYSRGTFLQVLEGRELEVDETYSKIAKDTRHQELVVLEKAPILRRSFNDWTMGFRHGDRVEAAALSGYTPILDRGFSASDLIRDPNFAKELLQKFAQGSRETETPNDSPS